MCLAEGILQNTVSLSFRQWDRAWYSLEKEHGPKEEWLPQLVDGIGFEATAEFIKETLTAYRESDEPPLPRPPILAQDEVTGLLHSSDYRVCRDATGTAHNVSPAVAKLIEVLNLALQIGIPELNANTLLQEAQRRADPPLAKEIASY
jgi:hypothetical protein